MGVIRASGFHKISVGETALLVSTLSFMPLVALELIFSSAAGGSDRIDLLNDVVFILLSGAALLSFLIIFSGVVECGTTCKSMRRARLFILLQLIFNVTSVIFEGLDIDSFLNSPIIFAEGIIGTAQFLSSFLGLIYLLGGFREAWYICGGDEETDKSIASLRIQYAVCTFMLVMIFTAMVILSIFAYFKPNPSEAVISASKWAAICGFPAIDILAAWKVVIHIRIVRMSWRVTRTIAEISGG